MAYLKTLEVAFAKPMKKIKRHFASELAKSNIPAAFKEEVDDLASNKDVKKLKSIIANNDLDKPLRDYAKRTLDDLLHALSEHQRSMEEAALVESKEIEKLKAQLSLAKEKRKTKNEKQQSKREIDLTTKILELRSKKPVEKAAGGRTRQDKVDDLQKQIVKLIKLQKKTEEDISKLAFKRGTMKASRSKAPSNITKLITIKKSDVRRIRDNIKMLREKVKDLHAKIRAAGA